MKLIPKMNEKPILVQNPNPMLEYKIKSMYEMIENNHITIDERENYLLTMNRNIFYLKSRDYYHHPIYIVDKANDRVFSVGTHIVSKNYYTSLQSFFDEFDRYLEMIENKDFDIMTGVFVPENNE